MNDHYGYIYKVSNLLNNRVYIGQKTGLFNKNYYGSGKLIKQAIKKYGKINFKLEVITIAKTKEELDKLEKFYIAEHRADYSSNKMYNLSDGGEGAGSGIHNSFYGKTHTEAHKHTLKTRVHSPQCQCATCKVMRGEPHKSDCRCFCCNSHRGINPTHKVDCQCSTCKKNRNRFLITVECLNCSKGISVLNNSNILFCNLSCSSIYYEQVKREKAIKVI